MKKLVFLICMATLTVFVACNRDENEKNSIIIDGDQLSGITVFYDDDQGTECLVGGNRTEGSCATHKKIRLLFTDGAFAENVTWPTDYTYVVEITLYSPDLESLMAGNYQIMENYDLYYNEDHTGENVGEFWMEIPSREDIYYVFGAEGTFGVTGELPKLTIDFDVEVGYYEMTPARMEEAPNAWLNASGRVKGTFSKRTIGRF
jgi:hypothetical protein